MSESESTGRLSAGARFALLAYGSWGLFPLYWKQIQGVPALEILFHRVVWSVAFYVALTRLRTGRVVPQIRWTPRRALGLAVSALLVGTNWLIYIYGVNSNQIVETSLGYFINPLINVLLGVVVLGERLERAHQIAVGLAAAGVLVIGLSTGKVPWIALALGISFSAYGLIRKRLEVDALAGVLVESVALVLPCWWIVASFGPGLTAEHSAHDWAFLLGAGVATGLPLLWFSEAAKRLPYYLLGFFQYLAPTLQFLVGVVVFREAMTPEKLVGFALIWSGISLVLYRNLMRGRARVSPRASRG